MTVSQFQLWANSHDPYSALPHVELSNKRLWSKVCLQNQIWKRSIWRVFMLSYRTDNPHAGCISNAHFAQWEKPDHTLKLKEYSNQIDHSYFSGWFVTPWVSKIGFLFQSHIILTGFKSKFTFIRLFWHWLKLQFCIEFQLLWFSYRLVSSVCHIISLRKNGSPVF